MKLSNTLLQAMMLLRNESTNTYLVGGCVRDMLLQKEPKDFDIVTDVHMDKIEEVFKDNGWKVDATGQRFLVMFVSKNDEQFEIANFRKDIGFTDGRRPDKVEIGTMDDDARRRDFTVNAIYYEPMVGQVFFPLKESKGDIVTNVLRFVGKPKDRIKEDNLRIFRFYRFLTKGFVADKKSLKACREYFNEACKNITPERIRSEVERMVL